LNFNARPIQVIESALIADGITIMEDESRLSEKQTNKNANICFT
jgi:hypothetical protein